MREWELEDAEAAYEIFGDPRVTTYLPAGALKADVDEMRATLARVRGEAAAKRPFGFWAVERRDDGALVGSALLQPLPGQDRVEVGWHLAPEHWGRGYATEAARALLDLAFGPLGLATVYAVIVPGNLGSERVAERLGMTPGAETGELFGLHTRLWSRASG